MVGAVFYYHFTYYELKIILLAPILKYFLSKKANPKAWLKTPSGGYSSVPAEDITCILKLCCCLTKVRYFMLDCKTSWKAGKLMDNWAVWRFITVALHLVWQFKWLTISAITVITVVIKSNVYKREED